MRCQCVMKENDDLNGACDPAHKPRKCRMKAKKTYNMPGGKKRELCNGCFRQINLRWHPWVKKEKKTA